MPISVNAKNSRKEDSRSTNLALFTSFDDVDLSTMISQSFSHFHYNSYWSNPLVNCLLHPMTHQLRYSQVTKPTMTEWMFRLYVEKMHHYWKKLYHWNQCPMSRRMMTDEVVAKVAYFHYFYRDVSLLRTRFSYDQLIVSLERTQRVKTRRNKTHCKLLPCSIALLPPPRVPNGKAPPGINPFNCKISSLCSLERKKTRS